MRRLRKADALLDELEEATDLAARQASTIRCLSEVNRRLAVERDDALLRCRELDTQLGLLGRVFLARSVPGMTASGPSPEGSDG